MGNTLALKRVGVEKVRVYGQPFERVWWESPPDMLVLRWADPNALDWKRDALVALIRTSRRYVNGLGKKVLSSFTEAYDCSTKRSFRLVCDAVSIGVADSVTFYRLDRELVYRRILRPEITGLALEPQQAIPEEEIGQQALRRQRLKVVEPDEEGEVLSAPAMDSVRTLTKPVGQTWTKKELSALTGAKVEIEGSKSMPHRIVALTRPWHDQTFHQVLNAHPEDFKVKVVAPWNRWKENAETSQTSSAQPAMV